ncbi:type II toxin-antitoxin system RelE family toxin [Embleya sp. AB8]|uniref:type II toxin-antitoxin system RelE family toxin n=1 Tax=Embleya sp. AB8 TaxID=3156304 RepID=UPI003C789114
MSYSVRYSPRAQRERDALAPGDRNALDAGIESVARDPYGCGSTPTYDKDRREVTVGRFFVGYQVSPGVMYITVVQIVGPM